ncbi:ATP-binding protein [Zooshikella harenae]|uniref:histidine kinase n=1 Tax=Zooshikella harenae TaxID=2827238 RepID=A0ABS5ZDF2_9GAMM|nr:ATP-binding protein [Zooshikella harenae]MBU2712010.1 HAMP domain-containing protein [Zooshikella harenae]
MTSIFLRIYGGLLFTLILVAVLSGLAVTIINSFRLQDYQESVAQGTFNLVAMQLAGKPEDLQLLLLQQAEHLLGIPLVLVEAERTTLSQAELARLKEKEVVVSQLTPEKAHVYSMVDEHTLLRGRVTSISEQLAYGSVMLIKQHLISMPFHHRQAQVAELQHVFSYPLSYHQAADSGLSAQNLQRLRDGHMVMLLGPDARSIRLFVGLEGGSNVGLDATQQVLEVGPIRFLEMYPFKLVFTISLFAFSSISLAIYILVRGLEKRLRKMERAATKISRGDLDARVNVRGSDSVGRLARAFNGMASHIQRLLSIQQEMIRGVSHELRTPVARLRFGLQMVEDAQSADERENYLGGMDKDIQELDHLIDEILTYASLEQGSPVLHFKRIDVDDIITQVIKEHLALANGIALEHIPCPASEPKRRAEVERRYMQRAIQNLVGNALRYAKTKVTVRYTVTSETCRVDVEDDGPGIPENEWDRVFTAFARLDDSRTRASGGYGLGLSIVRRIVYWHNGRALVGHSEMGGARFSIVWPRRQ